jgi:hypothetical protein
VFKLPVEVKPAAPLTVIVTTACVLPALFEAVTV